MAQTSYSGLNFSPDQVLASNRLLKNVTDITKADDFYYAADVPRTDSGRMGDMIYCAVGEKKDFKVIDGSINGFKTKDYWEGRKIHVHFFDREKKQKSKKEVTVNSECSLEGIDTPQPHLTVTFPDGAGRVRFQVGKVKGGPEVWRAVDS